MICPALPDPIRYYDMSTRNVEIFPSYHIIIFKLITYYVNKLLACKKKIN